MLKGGRDGHGNGEKTGDGQSRKGDKGVVDLARVIQRAVLKISVDEDGKRRSPYHWAAFTLHRAWM